MFSRPRRFDSNGIGQSGGWPATVVPLVGTRDA
jgi:hypothetical protein